VLRKGDTGIRSGCESAAVTPRWVKVIGIIVIVLILMVGVMMLGGGHGPGVHIPSGG
jgi:hypothetical protein